DPEGIRVWRRGSQTRPLRSPRRNDRHGGHCYGGRSEAGSEIFGRAAVSSRLDQYRRGQAGQPERYARKETLGADVRLQPGDSIYVGASKSGKLDRFMRLPGSAHKYTFPSPSLDVHPTLRGQCQTMTEACSTRERTNTPCRNTP